MTQKYYNGKVIIAENTSYVTCSITGNTLLRREIILEDGTERIEESPVLHTANVATEVSSNFPHASAPSEEEVLHNHHGGVPVAYATPEVPIAHATHYNNNSNNSMLGGGGSSSGTQVATVTGPPRPPPRTSIAIVTGPAQPPRTSVAVVTGPPPPRINGTNAGASRPNSNYTMAGYQYRNNDGALTCCGITCFITLLVCGCCFLPVIVVVWVLATSWRSVNYNYNDNDLYN